MLYLTLDAALTNVDDAIANLYFTFVIMDDVIVKLYVAFAIMDDGFVRLYLLFTTMNNVIAMLNC